MAAVLEAGLFWLNPMLMVVDKGKMAVVVEWEGLKPCWVLLTGNELVRNGRISFSKIFDAGHRREMGLYDLL